jgi:S-adenosylmethionine hydrolase
MKKIIALATDFGLKSAYAGIMKGAIWSVNPDVEIVDLTHGIEPFDILEAYYVIRESFEYFPRGTVFVAVVDPGVGSDRRIIGIDYLGKIFLVPDNGLAWALVFHSTMKDARIFSITERKFFSDNISDTFHGRDIFAPVAAWIASGVKLDKTGIPVDAGSLVPMNISEAVFIDNGSIEGKIVRTDGFGNLITDINRRMFAMDSEHIDLYNYIIEISDSALKIDGISNCYDQSADGKPVALFGSSGYLEIAVKGSNAMAALSVSKGSGVIVSRK